MSGPPRPPSQRNLTIYHRRNEGDTFVAIALDYGISRGRAHQIYRDTRSLLRFIARTSGTCPTCRREMVPIVDANELTRSA